MTALAPSSVKKLYEQLQGVWLIEMGELTATRKSDIEATKMFLSKSEDGLQTCLWPAHYIGINDSVFFFGTSNDKEFLRDKTGDRRSWPVDCYVQLPMKDVFGRSSREVDQIWAEAVVLYKQGHPLILDDKAAKAALGSSAYTQKRTRNRMIIEYLDRLYPNNWEDMDPNERRMVIRQ